MINFEFSVPFFLPGDSGSAVFLIDEKDQQEKALGIAFALGNRQTAVCDIRKIAEALNVTVYRKEEPMEIS